MFINKIFCILALVLVLFFAGCSEEKEVIETQLTIKNESSRNLNHPTWNNTIFHDNSGYILSGRSITEAVQHGSGYIFFGTDRYAYRTNESLTVNNGKNEEFVFTDNTLIISGNRNEPVKLGDVY